MAAADARSMFAVALAVSVVSAGIFVWACRSSHRWTFYKSRKTGPEHMMGGFNESDESRLIEDCQSADQLRCYLWLVCHPSYYDKDAVKVWLLSLGADNELFAREDRKLPAGCSDITGHSLGSFFEKAVEQYRWFGDDEGLGEVEAHLAAVKIAVNSKVFEKVEGDGDGDGDGEKREIVEESEVDRLKRVVSELKRANAEKDETNEELMRANAEKDETIAELKKTQ
jgi:hypothetical protein